MSTENSLNASTSLLAGTRGMVIDLGKYCSRRSAISVIHVLVTLFTFLFKKDILKVGQIYFKTRE
jgi:hypothetical protein